MSEHPAAMAEVERIRAIMTHEAAAGFRALAQMLAFELALSPDQAAAILEAAQADATARRALQSAGPLEDLQEDDGEEDDDDDLEEDDDDE